MFYIGFVSGARTDVDGRLYAVGDATVGEHSQRFESDLGHWSMAQYEEQWREAVLRLAAGGEASAFVTSYYGAEDGRHAVLPMWREGSTVFVQPPLILDADPDAFDDANDIYSKIGERGTMSAAAAIAEWQLPLGQMLAFAVEE